MRILIGQVFRYGIATGRINFDPTSALKSALPSHRKRHYPAQTEPEKLASILKAIWDYPHSLIVRNALRVLVYTFQRPGEVVSMKWENIDWEKREWRFTLKETYRPYCASIKPSCGNTQFLKDILWKFTLCLSKPE